jgi:hypothetical protein
MNLKGHERLLKDAPVPVFDAILEKTCNLRIILVRGVADSCNIPHGLLCIWGNGY